MKVSEATEVDVKEQELLLASGQAVKPKTLVMDYIKNDQVRNNETLSYQYNCPGVISVVDVLLLLSQESLTL